MFAVPLTLDQIREEAIKLPPAATALLRDKLVQSLETRYPDEIRGFGQQMRFAAATRFAPGRCNQFPVSR